MMEIIERDGDSKRKTFTEKNCNKICKIYLTGLWESESESENKREREILQKVHRNKTIFFLEKREMNHNIFDS